MKKFGRKRILETKFLYCNKHGETEFVETGKINKRWKCCKCVIAYSSNYRIRMKQKAVEYKGGKCEMCGYSKYIGALTFHHKDANLKDFTLAGTGVSKSWNKLVVELDKCRLVCLNCHLEIHHEIDAKNKMTLKTPDKIYNRKQINWINSKKLGKKPSL